MQINKSLSEKAVPQKAVTVERHDRAELVDKSRASKDCGEPSATSEVTVRRRQGTQPTEDLNADLQGDHSSHIV